MLPAATIQLSIQNPSKPEDIDEYNYANGSWGEPAPIQLSGGGDLKDNLMPLSEIDFATCAKVSEIWKEKAKEVEGVEQEYPHIMLFVLSVQTQERSWSPNSIEGTRAEWLLECKPDGTIKKLEKK